MRRASSRANDQLSRGIIRGRASSPSRTSSTAFGLSRSSLGYGRWPRSDSSWTPPHQCSVHLYHQSAANDRYSHNFDVFPERKTKFLKKDQYPSKLSIIQLTFGDFRHKSARRVRTRYGTLNCTAARHYLQRASARSVRRQYLIACAPDH